MTAPKMMFASGCTASCTRRAASLISKMPRFEPPWIESSTPWAPSIEASSSGLATASSAALIARSAPRDEPMPMRADPAPCMTDFTSAKSRLMRPGVVMRSVMPCTPASSTWSAVANASSIEMPRSLISSSRSFGTTMRVSTSFFRRATPCSAWVCRDACPRSRTACVTTPMVSAPIDLRDARDDGGAAGAGAAALARGDEHHVGARERLFDLFGVVFGGATADLGIGARAEAASELAADVELDVGVAHQQRLRVGVDRDELDPAQSEFDHAVDGVDAAAADADDLDHGEVVLVRRHVPASERTGKSQPQAEVEILSQYDGSPLRGQRGWPSEPRTSARVSHHRPEPARRARQSERKTALPGADTSYSPGPLPANRASSAAENRGLAVRVGRAPPHDALTGAPASVSVTSSRVRAVIVIDLGEYIGGVSASSTSVIAANPVQAVPSDPTASSGRPAGRAAGDSITTPAASTMSSKWWCPVWHRTVVCCDHVDPGQGRNPG